MATKPVKNILSTYTGAPTLNGVAGSGIAVLDAFLVNGFNLVTLTSLAVAGGVLTGNKTAHGFSVNQVIETAGANEADLNGQWIVSGVTANAFTADAAGIPNVTGTGTISAKSASLGWEKVYSGTNKAVYRSPNPAGTRLYLRVDDSAAQDIRLIGYEAMTDIDTGTGLFPTTAQLSGGVYWRRSNVADSSARAYVMVGDDRGFFANLRFYLGISASCFEYFGDFPSEKPGDAYSCVLTGQNSAPGAYSGTNFTGANMSKSYISRSYTQLGSSVDAGTFSNVFGLTGNGSLAYPSPANNGLVIGAVYKLEGASVIRCAKWPGVYVSPQAAPLTHLDVVDGVGALSGRKIVTIVVDTSVTAAARVFIDLTGPWW